MSTIACVEPAAATPGINSYLVLVAATDELLFPHVDSCIAIAFVMMDGRMVGGHVGMQMPTAIDLDPYGNALKICEEMIALIGVGPIARVILVGDGNWEKDYLEDRNVVEAIINLTACENTLFIDTGAYGGGVDFSLNPRRHMMFLQRCTLHRPLVFQRSYAQIVEHKICRLG